jgi:transposase
MSDSYVGVDVSKSTLDAFIEVNGKAVHHKFGNIVSGFRDLVNWLRRHGIKDPHICMEATGPYWEKLANYMFDCGYLVSVINPSCVKRFAQSELKRAKTDKVDAGVIFRFARAMKPGSWTPPPEEVRLLQALSRRLHALVKMRRQELNRMEAEEEKLVKRSISSVAKAIESEMEKVRKKIKELLMAHDYLKKKSELLLSIPGIGKETVHLLLAEIPDLEMFDTVKQLVAFAGLAPREYQSGTSIRGRNALTKTGNSRLRRGLYMSALVAMKWNPTVADFCERLSSRGKPTMKVLGAAMRKLLHIVYGVLKSGKPYNALLAKS